MPILPPLLPLGDPDIPYASIPSHNRTSRRRLRDRSYDFDPTTRQPIHQNNDPRRSNLTPLDRNHRRHSTNDQLVTVQMPVHVFQQYINPSLPNRRPFITPHAPRTRMLELENIHPAPEPAPQHYFDAVVHDLHIALAAFTSVFTSTTSSFLTSIALLHCTPTTRNVLWTEHLHMGTLEHSPFDHANSAIPQDLIEQIINLNTVCEKLGDAFGRIEGMSEQVSPARQHLAQARSGVKGDRERSVRELKRVGKRGVELLGEMKEDYGAVEELGRCVEWVEGVIRGWVDFSSG
jgi:hypothetical protein